MKMNIKHKLCLAVILFLVAMQCTHTSSKKIKIAATTMLLGSIVHQIGADKTELITIVPAGMCPGHFDMTSENIMNLNESAILLCHGWETWTGKLLEAVDNKPSLRKIGTGKNMMVPDNHIAAAANITAVLCSLDNTNRDYYIENHRRYVNTIDSLVDEIKVLSSGIKGVKVICSALQEEFIQWLGMDIVMVYPRAEELTPKILADAISRAKHDNIRLVIDNLQSGADAGFVIAEEMKTKHIVLTNFPLGDSYPKTLMQNFLTVLQALE